MVSLLLSGCAHSPRPWTKEEKLALIPSALSVAANYQSTVDMLADDRYEMNPCMSKYPDKSELLSKFAFAYGLTITLAHFFPNWRGQILGLQIGWCTAATMFDTNYFGNGN